MAGTIISAVCSIICGALLFYWQRAQSKRDAAAEKAEEEREKRSEKRSEQRRKESLLGLKMQQANGNLSRAVALALEEGRINGNVSAAVAEYDAACAAYAEFLAQIGISQIKGN